MKLNLRGGLAAMAGSVGQTTQLMINDEVSRMREQRMAQISQQAVQQQQGFQQEMQGNQQQFQVEQQDKQLQAQGVMAQNKMQAESEQAMLQRSQELRDAETKQAHELEKVELQAKLDPRANKTVINTGDASSAYQKKFDEGRAGQELEAYEEVKKRATSAYELEDSISIMEKLNESFETGKRQEFMAELGRWVETDASKALETYRAAVAPLVLEKLNAATGPQTDQDAIRIEQAVSNFGTSNEANRVAIDLIRKQMRRATQRYDEMTNYLDQKGNLHGYRIPSDVRLHGGASTPTQANPSNGSADDPLGIL